MANLVVFGQAVTAGPNQRYALGDWGFLVTLEGGVEEGDADAVRRARERAVTAVHVTLTAEHAGLPAGTEILIGHAEAATAAPIAQAPTTTAAPTTTTKKPPRKAGAAEGAAEAVAEAARGRQGRPEPPRIRPVPTDISAALSPGGYVFPVHGPFVFRRHLRRAAAGVGWHHGEDIFAPIGRPSLAVTSGTLFSVGWNDIGGYRSGCATGRGTSSTTRTCRRSRRSRSTASRCGPATWSASSATRATPRAPRLTSTSRSTPSACCRSATTA